jgi:hypothetical protein
VDANRREMLNRDKPTRKKKVKKSRDPRDGIDLDADADSP